MGEPAFLLTLLLAAHGFGLSAATFSKSRSSSGQQSQTAPMNMYLPQQTQYPQFYSHPIVPNMQPSQQYMMINGVPYAIVGQTLSYAPPALPTAGGSQLLTHSQIPSSWTAPLTIVKTDGYASGLNNQHSTLFSGDIHKTLPAAAPASSGESPAHPDTSISSAPSPPTATGDNNPPVVTLKAPPATATAGEGSAPTQPDLRVDSVPPVQPVQPIQPLQPNDQLPAAPPSENTATIKFHGEPQIKVQRTTTVYTRYIPSQVVSSPVTLVLTRPGYIPMEQPAPPRTIPNTQPAAATPAATTTAYTTVTYSSKPAEPAPAFGSPPADAGWAGDVIKSFASTLSQPPLATFYSSNQIPGHTVQYVEQGGRWVPLSPVTNPIDFNSPVRTGLQNQPHVPQPPQVSAVDGVSPSTRVLEPVSSPPADSPSTSVPLTGSAKYDFKAQGMTKLDRPFKPSTYTGSLTSIPQPSAQQSVLVSISAGRSADSPSSSEPQPKPQAEPQIPESPSVPTRGDAAVRAAAPAPAAVTTGLQPSVDRYLSDARAHIARSQQDAGFTSRSDAAVDGRSPAQFNERASVLPLQEVPLIPMPGYPPLSFTQSQT